MKSINYQQVPSSIEEDINRKKTTWNDGKLRKIDEGTYETYYIGHRQVEVMDEEDVGHMVTEAMAIRVKKPYDIDKVLKAATMSAYCLYDDEAYNSFQSNLAVKYRTNPNDVEVRYYDEFIKWVRNSLECDELETAREKMLSEIDIYDKSEAVNSFILDGEILWLDKDTRVGLMNSTQIQKAASMLTTTLWFGGKSYTLSCDTAIQMLSALELYALQCYNVTAQHKANVENLQSVEEVEAYDYTTGYPEKLNLNTK